MRTVVTKILAFNELNENAKQSALDYFRYINTEHDWYTHVYECIQESTNLIGLDDIRFSGFCSQGDGASFEYNVVDKVWERWVNTLNLPNWKKDILKYVTVDIDAYRNTRHYVHENTVSIRYQIEELGYTNLDNFIEKYATIFLDNVSKRAKILMHNLYKALEKEYDYLTSDEAVGGTILSNGYEFTEVGRFYN